MLLSCLEFCALLAMRSVLGLCLNSVVYASQGRATLEMKVSFKDSPKGDKSGVMTLVCDGLSAPVSAGNFVDLVQKRFYNGMEIQRADGFVVQTGRPDKGDGYVGPSGEVRR